MEKKLQTELRGIWLHALTPEGTGFVTFCCVPCTQEDTNDNKKKEVYFMKYKMVSK
jgi:hypothetical protein